MLTLFSYNVSPYAAKVRAVLRYKGIPFEERIVHPLRRGELVRLSRQVAVPVIDDDGTIVADSTRIVAYLDARHPEPPVIPRDPGLRARALLLEETFDEGLAATIQPVRWLMPPNARRTAARFRSAYRGGVVEDMRMALVNAVMRIDMRRKHGGRSFGVRPPAELLARLGELCDVVDAALAETDWLAGPAPSVADFALYGWLAQLEGLDGWQAVESHHRIARLIASIAAGPVEGVRDGASARVAAADRSSG